MSPPRIDSAIGLWRRHLPSVRPFYAVKCNPSQDLLHHLYDAGIGFDCASERELKEVQALARTEGVGRIIYANPCKSDRDIKVAKGMGAPLTVVDSEEEVEKLAGYSGGALIRIAVDDTGSAMPFSSKFGAPAKNIGRIAQAAKANGLALRGISFHVGSGSADRKAHARAIREAYAGILLLGRLGYPYANMIDIGGGYLPSYKSFSATAAAITEAMLEVENDNADSVVPIQWIAEPGRFLAANSFDFYVQVIGKKASPVGWKYTIDDSLYGQFSGILFDYAAPTWVRVSDGAPRKRGPGVLFGRTCDSVDVIAKATDMEELEIGDWLWFPNMGAYTRATASEFNGFPAPEVFIDETLDVPALHDVIKAAPCGVKRMPPVSAKAFW